MQPFANLLRPQTLDGYFGQIHLVGKEKPIRKMIELGKIPSMIFWGPPGVGKTSLARIIANETDSAFVEMSAVSAKKDDIKKVVEKIQKSRGDLVELINAPEQTILFLDEIHRFNKAQQDFLLPYVEDGTITLIGATTENPSFEVIAPLLSRARVFVLNELGEKEMGKIIDHAVDEINKQSVETRSFVSLPKNNQEQSTIHHQPPARNDTHSVAGRLTISNDAKQWLIAMANGDARQALTMIDNTLQLYDKLTVETFTQTLQSKHLRYDKQGEEHYNTISAFIKSMRASNVDAALYYLARMVDSGEDPKFIARRMVVFASEDIGVGQPTALVVANAVFEAVNKIGYPEAQINLAHGVTYLCQCKKDRSAYDAYFQALSDVKKYGNLPIPLNLRNAPTKLMKKLDYGKGYEMYTDESLLPEELKGKKYYT